ncbi:tetratricopeptide repeat protein [Nocardia carnea]|uniref:tetratricopeptide repeat protein n=1 Tax=Nocardia carnea TaxID=37328 RepID=UPI00245703BF|nr:tetratricopeptide repeat protein [Nocardia carnea]
MTEPLPRSAVVPGVLGGLSVLATTLLLELGRTLVMNSFGESDGVRLLSSGLRWLAVLIVVLAVLYAGYRFAMERRARLRLVARRDTLAVLDGTRPAGPPVTRDIAAPTDSPHIPGWRSDVVAALRELPVRSYDTATLHAVLAAVAAVHDDLPGPLPRPAESASSESAEPGPLALPCTAPGLRQRLEHCGVLDHRADHYVLVKVPEAPAAPQVRAGSIWPAALYALLSHCAGQAASWAVALTRIPFAPGARRWFTVEQAYLVALVERVCAPPGTGGRSAGHPDGARSIPPATVVQLVRIADALDIWYSHQVRMSDDQSAAVAATLGRLTERSAMSWYTRSMELRQPQTRGPGQRPAGAGAGAQEHRLQTAGDPAAHPEPPRRGDSQEHPAGPPCGVRRQATGLAARWQHRAALEQLSTAGTARELEAAVQLLRAAWWRLPREDATNQVRVLANLAVAHIEQGRLDAAADRLELAAVRAAGEEDDDGRALVHELDGAVCWARGEPRSALRHWQRALTLYDDLADDRGIARCLHHIGSAVLVVPEHADVVLGDDPLPAARDISRNAQDWLGEAAARRTGGPPPRVDRRPLRAGGETGGAGPESDGG